MAQPTRVGDVWPSQTVFWGGLQLCLFLQSKFQQARCHGGGPFPQGRTGPCSATAQPSALPSKQSEGAGGFRRNWEHCLDRGCVSRNLGSEPSRVGPAQPRAAACWPGLPPRCLPGAPGAPHQRLRSQGSPLPPPPPRSAESLTGLLTVGHTGLGKQRNPTHTFPV